MNENERVRLVRKDQNLTMEEFGRRIGVTKNAISMVERGTNSVSTQMATAICREFDVSESWLRTGDGDMYRRRTRGEEIAEVVRSAAATDPDEAVKFFTALLADMTDAEILLMYEVVRRHFPK